MKLHLPTYRMRLPWNKSSVDGHVHSLFHQFLPMEKKMPDLKTKLITRLTQLGMTQRDLETEIGVTEATISRYVNGEREPNDELLARIAESLEVTVGYFKDERDNKVEDLEQINKLIARNEKNMTSEEKLAIIRLLSRD